MPPDQPEKQSDLRNRRHRSLSVTMSPSDDVIDISDTSEPGTSGSRKHGRQGKAHPHTEGPRKRQKTNRGSEPPMRKDTTMTPKAKREKSRRKINHHKASRTSEHQKLKEKAKILELELESARQAYDDANRELEENVKWHAEDIELLKQRHSEQAEEARAQKQMVATERQENQRLKHKLEDLANHVEALQRSCQSKDEELEGKEKDITAKQKELDDSRGHSARLVRSLGEKEATLKSKDEVITAFEKDLDHSTRHSASLEQHLAETEVKLKGKEELITAKGKELDDSKSHVARFERYLTDLEVAFKENDELLALKEKALDDSKNHSASLEQSLAEKEFTIKGKDELIASHEKELDHSKNQSASLKASLGEMEQELQISEQNQSEWHKKLAASEEKLASTEWDLNEAKEELEKTRHDAEALHRVNDANGHRIEDLRSNFEAERVELQASLEDQESKQNHMVASLQQKLKESRQQGQRYNHKQPDEKAKADFTSLECRIRQFVDKYARPVHNAPEQELETIWSNWSPKLRNFLASPLLCNQVLEAYVWECLLARVFAPESAIWSSKLGRSLEKTLSMAADETAQSGFKSDLYIDFQYLRSSSSSLIGRLNGANFRPKSFDSDVKTMVATLATLTGFREINDTMKDEAMQIFKAAHYFEIQLRMLKAKHTIRMHKAVSGTGPVKYGFDFADEDMDDVSPNRSGKAFEQARSVDFIMRPGLYKRGNNSGANYETKTCLIKMGVVCNTTELFQMSGPSSPARLSSKSKKAKKGSSISDPLHVEAEGTDSQQYPGQFSTSGLTSGSAPPKPSDTVQMQSDMATTVRTRSQAPQRTGSNLHAGKSSTKPTDNHLYPTGTARGRGGGSPAKKTRSSKRSDSDQEWTP